MPTRPAASARARSKPHEARLLRLATWILSHGAPITRGQIYEEFSDHYRGKADTRERMFTRDKEALRRLGFLLETVEVDGPDQVGYTIDARASMLPAIELSPDEAAAAWTAGVAALRLSRHPLRDELESALRKLLVGTKGLPPRALATEEGPGRADGEGDRLLPRLADHWARRRRIRIEYFRVADGTVQPRDVDVYGWARRRGEWIFAGHCHLRGGVRIFYLSRVRSLKAAPVPREEARRRARRGREGDYDVPDDFDIRRWSRQQIWDYDVEPPVEATVRFRGSLAGIARQLLPSTAFTTDGTGARVARLPVRNLRGLVRQALAWGPEAEVTGPPRARAMAREILEAVLPTRGWGTP